MIKADTHFTERWYIISIIYEIDSSNRSLGKYLLAYFILSLLFALHCYIDFQNSARWSGLLSTFVFSLVWRAIDVRTVAHKLWRASLPSRNALNSQQNGTYCVVQPTVTEHKKNCCMKKMEQKKKINQYVQLCLHEQVITCTYGIQIFCS